MAEEAFTAELAKLVSHLTERLSGQEDGKPSRGTGAPPIYPLAKKSSTGSGYFAQSTGRGVGGQLIASNE